MSKAVIAMAQLDEALRYKPEGCGFDSLFFFFIGIIDIILPAALWPWMSSRSIPEMCTRNIS